MNREIHRNPALQCFEDHYIPFKIHVPYFQKSSAPHEWRQLDSKTAIFMLNIETDVCKWIGEGYRRAGTQSIHGPTVEPWQLRSRLQGALIVEARMYCYFVMRKHSRWAMTTTRIGNLYGRDHTTVLTQIDDIRYFLRKDIDSAAQARRHLAGLGERLAGIGWPGFNIWRSL